MWFTQDNYINNNKIIYRYYALRIKLVREKIEKPQLILDGKLLINEKLQEYGYPCCNDRINFGDTVRIHSRNTIKLQLEVIKLKTHRNY